MLNEAADARNSESFPCFAGWPVASAACFENRASSVAVDRADWFLDSTVAFEATKVSTPEVRDQDRGKSRGGTRRPKKTQPTRDPAILAHYP